MKRICSIAGLTFLLVTTASGQNSRPASPSLLETSPGGVPIYLVENRGLFPDEVKYFVHGTDKALFFTKEGITFQLTGKDRGWVVKLEFVGANPDVLPRGEDIQQAVFSYFKGPEKDWKAGLPAFSRIVYEDLWPGIDLAYRGSVNQLKYEFIVEPGADPDQILMRYRGATEVGAGKSMGLRIETPAGGFEDAPPVAWQEIGGERVPVVMAYRLAGGGKEARAFGFRVGKYDRTRPLILDPAIIVYCGYIGGASGASIEPGTGIAVDHAGNVYVTGETKCDHQTFPVIVGPDVTYNGGADAFVAKVNAQGTGLVYCGYIGGAGYDSGGGIAVDRAGNAYVTGQTMCDHQTFPVSVGPDVTFNGHVDGFVAKVNAQGTGLVYCGYIGGVSSDVGHCIALDPAGNAYMAGYTESDHQTFPVMVGPDPTHNGNGDAFVAKVNAQGTGLVYCGYIGGANTDSCHGITVDAAGNAYVAGYTQSDQQTFPVAVGPDVACNGGIDAFVAKVNAQGTGLVYCGYIGGTSGDYAFGISVDPAGKAYVAGHVNSDQQTFPVTVGPDLTHNGSCDAFVAKVNAQGTALDYCGYIGGASRDGGGDIKLDAAGNAYVVGFTESDQQTFPVTVGPDLTHNGREDAFVAKVSPRGTGLVYCGFIGGAAEDNGRSIALDAAGNAYVTGYAKSDQQTFPVTVGPDLTHNGGYDAFVAKISLLLLTGSGTTRPGGTVSLTLAAGDDLGLPYQAGSSLGTGPIFIGNRKVDLAPDDLLLVSILGLWTWVFQGYRGVIDSRGKATGAIHIPNDPALIGLRFHTAFVTHHPAAPSGIKSISNTISLSITK